MHQMDVASEVEKILQREMDLYVKAYRGVGFATGVLPLLMVVGIAGGLLEAWLRSGELSLHMGPIGLFAVALSAGAYLGYVFRQYQDAKERAGGVSAAKEAARVLGFKVVLNPVVGDQIRFGLCVVARSSELHSVDWKRDWSRWDCLAEFTR